MATYTVRAQTVLTAAQYEKLLQLAGEQHGSVSVLIREAVEQAYFVALDRQERQDALRRLLSLEAPVADWAQMEADIERGAAGE